MVKILNQCLLCGQTILTRSPRSWLKLFGKKKICRCCRAKLGIRKKGRGSRLKFTDRPAVYYGKCRLKP